jgi:nucleotide-binding universal stress UspA family protein
VPVLLKRLLCAVDFSDASLRAVELAFALGQEADAQVRLLHVVEPTPPAATPLAAPTPALIADLRRLETDARQRLARAVPADASDWCEPQISVARGKPWREIVRAAEETGSGLIVMGVRGHGLLDRFFFGSTAEGVVRHAGCPILVARPPGPAAEPKAA